MYTQPQTNNTQPQTYNVQPQTYNIHDNQQIQIYNYSGGRNDDQAPREPTSTVQSRNPLNDGGGQSSNGDSRFIKGASGTLFPQVQYLADQINATNGNVNAVKSGVDAVANGVNAVNGNVNQVKSDVNALGTGLGEVSTKLDSVQGDVTRVLGGFGKFGKDLGQVNGNLASLQTQTSQNTKALTDIKTVIGNLAPSIVNINREVSGLKAFEDWSKQNCDGSRHAEKPTQQPTQQG
jgi:hypothetical protein